jgi:RimJ/RimL family protein N-acetyltransferase
MFVGLTATMTTEERKPHALNSLGQPIGAALPGWRPPPLPPREPMRGRFCTVEPLDLERHAGALYAAVSLDREGHNWTYVPAGPFDDFPAYLAWLEKRAAGADPMFHAIVDAMGRAVGTAAYQRMDPANGVVEIGNINYSPLLQRTPAATEAMYLMMRRVFELGYRRYEWKCDTFNAPSRKAAQRYGFSFEGVFRQSNVVKGRTRDSAWFSILDGEWPALRVAYERWLTPDNFAADGRQCVSLSSLTAPLLKAKFVDGV